MKEQENKSSRGDGKAVNQASSHTLKQSRKKDASSDKNKCKQKRKGRGD